MTRDFFRQGYFQSKMLLRLMDQKRLPIPSDGVDLPPAEAGRAIRP